MAGKTPPKKIEYKGELISYHEVAKKLGISTTSMRKRVNRFEKGEIDETTLFAPHIKTVSAEKNKKRGKRAMAMDHFLECFDSIVKPHLEQEFERYMRTKEEGPAMAFYKTYKDFLCIRDKASDLDGQQVEMAAQAIVMPAGDQPRDYKKA